MAWYKKSSIKQQLENIPAGRMVAMGNRFDGNPSTRVEMGNN